MKINPYAPSEEVFKNSFKNVLNTSSTSNTSNTNQIDKVDNNIQNEKIDDENNKVSFSDALKSALDAVNDKQVKADNLTDSFTKGQDGVDITDVMLGTAEANTSLQYAVQIRNKLLDAYQEISKMQI